MFDDRARVASASTRSDLYAKRSRVDTDATLPQRISEHELDAAQSMMPGPGDTKRSTAIFALWCSGRIGRKTRGFSLCGDVMVDVPLDPELLDGSAPASGSSGNEARWCPRGATAQRTPPTQRTGLGVELSGVLLRGGIQRRTCPLEKTPLNPGTRPVVLAGTASWLFRRLLFRRLGDEHRDHPRGLRLVLLVRRKRRHRQLPEPRPLGGVLNLAHAHGLLDGEVADLNHRVGP